VHRGTTLAPVPLRWGAKGPHAAEVGAWFTGRNEVPGRTWETRSQVTVADAGTRVTEAWEFLPAGLDRFAERYGDDAPAQIAERTDAARRGIPATLAALKEVAEAS